MKFSLIVATLGRKNELEEMLYSLNECDFNLNEIEIILVDQNPPGYLDSTLKTISLKNIKHLVSSQKGLSLNRNIGIEHATGEIICFPDDDCKFYPDTFSTVDNYLKNPGLNFCIGKIFDRSTNKNIIKKWPNNKFRINKFNSYFVNSSITLFVKKYSAIEFDDLMGVGASFGSCEDADYIYRLLEKKNLGYYFPDIHMWHPSPVPQKISLDKVYRYASGFGFFIRKDCDFVKVILFFLLILKKTLQAILNYKIQLYPKDYFKKYFSGLIFGLTHKKLPCRHQK